MNLGPQVNRAFGDFNPQISPDGLTLYFGSNRPGACGGFDIWKTTRKQIKGNDQRE